MARIVLATCVVCMCALLPLASAAGVRVDPKTQQLLDANGRVRVFHGVNAGACVLCRAIHATRRCGPRTTCTLRVCG